VVRTYKKKIHTAIDNALEDYPNAKIADAIFALGCLISELKRSQEKDGALKIAERSRYRIL
jgi:hypothetical protein